MANVRARVYDPWSPMVVDTDPSVELSVAAVIDKSNAAKVNVAASPKAATTYDWGDSSPDTVSPATGKSNHTYDYNGTYTITGTQGALSGTQTIVIDAPTATPGAPTAVAGAGKALAADLTWVAPASDGRSAITGYKIEKAPGPAFDTWAVAVANTATTAVSKADLALTAGDWKFRVSAINAVGTGAASTASASVTATT